MSIPVDCCNPCGTTPPPVDVIGSPGQDGATGADGASSYAILSAGIVVPAIGANVAVTFSGPSVIPTAWMIVGMCVIIGEGQTVLANPGPATFRIASVDSNTQATLTKLDSPADVAPGTNISAAALCSPEGEPAVLASALPTALTDNSTGSASNTIAAGAGVFTHSIFFRAAAITGNVLLYTYTPGYKFKILKISASVVDAITTGAKAATLTTAINGVNTTGGIVIMSGTYALGAEQASSAAITGNNTGTNAQAITVTASAVTAFTEGGFMLEMQIQNMDTADAVASLADHINDLITALTV